MSTAPLPAALSKARRRTGWWPGLAAVLVVLAVWAGPAQATALRLVVGGLDKQVYLPVLLAQRLGLFAEQGLEVELIDDASGVRAEEQLLTGAVQGVVGFYDHAIVLQARGKFVRSVVQFSRTPGEVVVAGARATPLRSPADFKGRALGVAGLGGSTHWLMQYLGQSHGVRVADMEFVPLGIGALVDALEQGRVDAVMTTEPTATRLQRAGRGRQLLDLRTPEATAAALGGPYPGACLYMASAWVEAHRPQVQKLANALVRALRYIDGHSAAELAMQVAERDLGGDRAAWVAALTAGKSMFIPDGRMPAEGPANVLRVLGQAQRAVQGQPIDLARTFTTEFVDAAR
ncbi:ABC transporter substrate-binding protein [Azohydromonas lata]|uniref:ABC transporter substrate-binding protein n=1 Tax=Azohydromonas lata TaxID=45677 RepID=UPI0009FC37AF|nr:ABC transporter substrate-binding protein [Azohydromonas lata]